MPRKMHPDEIETSAALVRGLLAEQFPEWAGLAVARVPSWGTDNALYRIGDALVARLPRREQNVPQVHKELTWLPQLAPQLPVPIPEPLALGRPGLGYPFDWAVCRWLDGEHPLADGLEDPESLGRDLAAFVTALRAIDPAGGPTTWRGAPVRTRDVATRRALAQLDDDFDAAEVLEQWERALRAPDWKGPAVWLHADLAPANVLVRGGRLAGIIDFGTLGIGDPACDLIVAWNLLAADARETFRAAVDVDEATWERGRGWALSIALLAIPYYQATYRALADNGRRVLRELLR